MIGALLSSAGGCSRQPGPKVGAENAALAAAVGAVRPLEGRLVGFGYAPRGRRHLLDPSDRRQLATVRSIARLARRRKSTSARVAAAVVKLLSSHLDQSLRQLEDAVDRDPSSTLALTDLAAVYIEKGQRDDDPYDFDLALVAAEAALRLRPASPEAAFNRALALEHLHLDSAARTAWQAYSRTDRGSPWADEARDHALRQAPRPGSGWARARQDLDAARDRADGLAVRSIVAASPQPCREYAEQELLSTWARERDAVHRSAALRALHLAAAIGSALAAINGDRLTLEAARAVQSAMATPGDRRHLDALARGHRAFRDGLDRLQENDHQGAFAAFDRARSDLAQGASPMSEWASLYRVVAKLKLSRFADANAEIEDLLAQASAAHASLRARAGWLQGLVRIYLAQPLAAQGPYQVSLAAFRRLGETENAAVLEHLLAEDLEYLGERHEAWRHRLRALAERSTIRDPQRISSILDEAAQAAIREREWPLALHFYDAMVEHAEQWGDPYVLVYTHLRRSRVRLAVGQVEPALSDQRRAERQFGELRDASLRRRVAAEAALTSAQIQAAFGRYPRAVAELDRLVEYYRSTGYAYDLAQAYALRWRCRRALGDVGLAATDLAAGIAAWEGQIGTPGSERLVLSHLDQLRELLDEMRIPANVTTRSDEGDHLSERSDGRRLVVR